MPKMMIDTSTMDDAPAFMFLHQLGGLQAIQRYSSKRELINTANVIGNVAHQCQLHVGIYVAPRIVGLRAVAKYVFRVTPDAEAITPTLKIGPHVFRRCTLTGAGKGVPA